MSGRSGFQIRQVVDASRAWTRIVAHVDQVANQRIEAHPRGAKAVIDQRTAARLSAVVGDGEFQEHAAIAEGGRAPEKPHPAAPQGRIAPVTAGIAALACLWAGARANHDFGNTVAHAAAAGGSFEAPTAAAGPMFGASRDPGEAGGDPAMTPKNSARVAAMVVAAAVTANGALAGDAVQWRVEDGGNGHWYRIDLIAEGASWTQCKSQSASIGGHLATITSASENSFLSTLVGTSGPWFSRRGNAAAFDGPWIGGFRETIQSPWQWVSGETWEFTAWCSNQPSDVYCPNGESTLSIKRDEYCDSQYNWGDVNETGICPPYITTMGGMLIEWDADCNSDGIVDYGQIRTGTLADANLNGIPDTCECATNPSLPSCCIGDIYRNGRVDGADLGALLSEWGPVTPLTNSDIDGNGEVNGADLGLLLSHWGPCGG